LVVPGSPLSMQIDISSFWRSEICMARSWCILNSILLRSCCSRIRELLITEILLFGMAIMLIFSPPSSAIYWWRSSAMLILHQGCWWVNIFLVYMLMVLTYDQSFDWVLFILNRNWIGLVSAKLHSPMRGLSWLLLISLVTLGKSPWISVMMKVCPVFFLESGKLWWTSWEKIGWFYPLCKYVNEFPWLWVVFFSTIFCFYNWFVALFYNLQIFVDGAVDFEYEGMIGYFTVIMLRFFFFFFLHFFPW